MKLLRDRDGHPLTTDHFLVRALQEAEAYRLCMQLLLDQLHQEREEHAVTREKHRRDLAEFRRYRAARGQR